MYSFCFLLSFYFCLQKFRCISKSKIDSASKVQGECRIELVRILLSRSLYSPLQLVCDGKGMTFWWIFIHFSFNLFVKTFWIWQIVKYLKAKPIILQHIAPKSHRFVTNRQTFLSCVRTQKIDINQVLVHSDKKSLNLFAHTKN